MLEAIIGGIFGLTTAVTAYVLERRLLDRLERLEDEVRALRRAWDGEDEDDA